MPDEWKCGECGPITSICPHLEKFLPREDAGRMCVAGVGEYAVATASFFSQMHPTHDPSSFVDLVRSYGFVLDWEIELLEAYYVRNMTLREISVEFNWVGGKDTVARRLSSMREEFLKRGITRESLRE